MPKAAREWNKPPAAPQAANIADGAAYLLCVLGSGLGAARRKGAGPYTGPGVTKGGRQ